MSLRVFGFHSELGISSFFLFLWIIKIAMAIITIVINIIRMCSILRFNVGFSGVADGDGVGVTVGVGVGLVVGVGVGDGGIVDVSTVAIESAVA